MKLYVDAALVDTDVYAGGISANNEPIVLGASSSNSDDLSATPLQDYFDGYIDDLRIYDQPFDAVQTASVMNFTAPGAGTLPGYIVADSSGNGMPLNLHIKYTSNISWIPAGGLSFDNPTNAISPAAASKIYSALTATDQMTLEIKFKPANITQFGPANMASYSDGTASRNFTFAQDGQKYLSRLRTSSTTSNGTPNIESASVLEAATTQHVIMTYDGEYIKMYRNGSSTAEVTLARDGTFNWDSSFKFMLGNEATDDRPWLGTFSRVAIYDKSVSGSQVTNVFSDLPPGPPSSDPQYVVVWQEMQ